jgi:beta-xylosidase
MKDYHVFSMDHPGGEVTDHGVALDIADVPWAGRQMWAPDAAYANDKYYLYFPVKDKNDVFAIGVATSDRPEGPFKAEPTKMGGTYSMDPTVFRDSDGEFYLYFGGIWGGQLERWQTGEYIADPEPVAEDADAIAPRIAKLNADMISLAETPRNILILDENGETIKAGDHDRRFFEASWVHKYNDKYYFSYSTGDTHFINYAVGDNPYGPFTYKGVILDPVIGWTSHHSIAAFEGQWYLFYHDSTLSGGVTHLRNIKMTPLRHNADGTISRISPYISRTPAN